MPVDFDINPNTFELRFNLPTEADSNNNNNNNINNNKPNPNTYSYSTGYNDVENNFDYESRTIPSEFSLQKYIYDSNNEIIAQQEPDYVNITLQVIIIIIIFFFLIFIFPKKRMMFSAKKFPN